MAEAADRSRPGGLRVVMLGAPGSGKGTQADFLAASLGVPVGVAQAALEAPAKKSITLRCRLPQRLSKSAARRMPSASSTGNTASTSALRP